MTFKIVFNLFLISITGTLAKNPRLYGGIEAAMNEFPFMASIRIPAENQFLCAAVIINSKSLLTIALRVYPFLDNLGVIKVVTGTSSTAEVGNIFDIREIHIHPFFDPENPLNNNICVIKIRDRIPFNDLQNRIPLSRVTYRTGILGWIVGWGVFTQAEGPTLSERFKKLPVHTVHVDDCHGLIPFQLAENHFCTYQGYGYGVCPGDAGGPVIVDGELYGIILFSGQQRGDDAPDIHASISHHHNFISLAMAM